MENFRKHNWIKGILVPLIMLAIFLMPISPALKVKKVEAAGTTTVTAMEVQGYENYVKITIKATNTHNIDKNIHIAVYDRSPGGNTIGSIDDLEDYPGLVGDVRDEDDEGNNFDSDTTGNQFLTFRFQNLEPDKSYWIAYGLTQQEIPPNGSSEQTMLYSGVIETKTVPAGSAGQQTTASSEAQSQVVGLETGCSWNPMTWFTNCIVLAVYQIIFQPIAFFAGLAAQVLDFFIYYSTSSSSYENDFIQKGWAAVRDIANIFFILALLFIAIKTILGIGISKNKELIGYILIMGVLINFSLFFSRVVIDSSNILAKIFYNNITTKSSPTGPEIVTANGEKSISTKLVSSFNPQKLAIESGLNVEKNLGTYFMIVIISIIMLGYTIYVFVSVSLLFVSRVVMLWLAMIFAPIAFASYALPFKIPGIGKEEWWDELLKNAFLAPLFIFFLYIILLFGDFISIIEVKSGNSTMQQIMGTLVPFFIVAILLYKAKSLAVKYSGELGAALNKAGAMVGGFATGAVLGGAAMLGTTAIGGAGTMLKNNKWLQNKAFTTDEEGNTVARKGFGGWAARKSINTGTKASKASFDLRKTPVGSLLSMTGLKNIDSSKMIGLGPKEGGFQARVDKKAKKLEASFEPYKTKMSNDEVKAWSAKNQADYDSKDENYKKTHSRPKSYSTAEELNNDRLKVFSDSIGKSGLMYGLSNYAAKSKLFGAPTISDISSVELTAREQNYKLAKEKARKEQGSSFDEENWDKTHKAPTKQTLLDERLEKRAKNIKLGLGAVAIAATAATGGLAGASILGTAAATAIGGGLGGAFAAGKFNQKTQAEKTAKASFAKQTNQMANVAERIKETETLLREILEKEKESRKYMFDFENGNGKEDLLSRDANGNLINDKKEIVSDPEKAALSKDKLSKAIIKLGIKEKSLMSRLDALNKTIAGQPNGTATPNQQKEREDIERTLTETNIEKNKIESFSTVREKKANLNNTLFNLGRSKSSMEKEISGSGASGAKPSGTPPPPPKP